MNFVLEAIGSGFREDVVSHWPTKQTLPLVGQALGPGTELWQPWPEFGQRGLIQFPKGINYNAGARQTSQHQWALVDGRTMQAKGIITRKGQDGRLWGPQEQDTNLAAARLGTWRQFSSLSHEPLGSGTVSQPGHCGIIF